VIIEDRADFINPAEIEALLTKRSRPAPAKVRELLAKAGELHGLSMEDVACLTLVENRDLLAEIFSAARKIKEEIY